MITAVSFADELLGKMIITGDAMYVKKDGQVTVAKGNSKATNDKGAIVADEMSYDKQNSKFFATGNVRLVSKTQKGEPFEAYGNFAKYDMNTQKGKIWGDYAVIKYYVSNSTDPFVLHAKEIYVVGKTQIFNAYENVGVVTSAGTVYADNGFFDGATLEMTFKKDKKRPIANVIFGSGKGLYEADEMIFYNYNSEDNKRIVMNGSVVGKIEMKDEIK